MRIGILVTSIGNFGKKGFYNTQEVGLAKALSSLCEQVIVYKAVHKCEDFSSEKIVNTDNAILELIPTSNFGINGIINTKVLDKNLDALIYFSDTQFSVPSVYKWCKKNKVKFIPYVGVTESHSGNKLVRRIINTLFERNLKVFRKSNCIVKTPTVQNELAEKGVRNTVVAPVGLDITLLNKDYAKADKTKLKEKYGYKADEKVLLFIGRLVSEKQPERIIEILSEIVQKDASYRLLMVGKGELKEKVFEKIQQKGLQDKVKLVEAIPNSEIWELYRLADAFINLNEQEIFGMVILEAMYYGCKVVALHAPGPNYIIENKISGMLCNNNEEIIVVIFDTTDFSSTSHNRILEHFTWENTARIIEEIIRG